MEEESYDFDLMRSFVHENMKYYLQEQDKKELINSLLDFYDQNDLLYSKLREWKGQIPKDYVMGLGIEHDWESNDVVIWLNMFMLLIDKAADIAKVDRCAMRDLKDQFPDAHQKIVQSRKKWSSDLECKYYSN